ncbi:hypothetical protein [Hymenobacter glacialis]|uniref:Uncharacterized protein n=1 Tax=Hymenobacter glacialis TaxID=1908236 RepID=A0A1G1T410_9BACT|nr:hypothetical protein [Hymenobacter glacialis]OGX85608.1 hypothetical protein BEN48_01890 [Hymenobacter glacialis]
MLKALITALLLAGTAPAAFAQVASAAVAGAKAPQYEHCILVLGDAYYDGRDVKLEFGQGVKDAPQNPELLQANAAVRKLRSVVAALNYMSSQGWECINVSTLEGVTGHTGYLLRRAR